MTNSGPEDIADALNTQKTEEQANQSYWFWVAQWMMLALCQMMFRRMNCKVIGQGENKGAHQMLALIMDPSLRYIYDFTHMVETYLLKNKSKKHSS